MRVVFWGTYDTGKPRVRILRSGIKSLGVEVEEIHTKLWEGVEDKSQVRDVSRWLLFIIRWLLALPRLIWLLCRTPKPDVVIVGYPGIFDVFAAVLVCRIRRVPLAWDMFISLYDTIIEDRRMFGHRHLLARTLYQVERLALRLPHLVFLDTHAHARRIESLFHLKPGTCHSVWVGAETEHFGPSPKTSPGGPRGRMQVLFYGQFIPLHGIPTIIEAARLLREAPIDWTLIGRGQEALKISKMLDDEPLSALRWIEWVPYLELRGWLHRADLCLGIFGSSEKAGSVVPNKVFQIVAAGRPLVTRDSPAIRELFPHGSAGVDLVPPDNAEALAAAIERHLARWSQSDFAPCHEELAVQIAPQSIGAQLLHLLQNRGNASCRNS